MGLFAPAWQSDNPKRRARGAASCRDQEVLKKLAAQDPEPEVRIAAIKNIDDSFFLAAVAEKLDHDGIRKAAIDAIAPEIALVLAEQSERDVVQRLCAAKLCRVGRAKDVTALICRSKNAYSLLDGLDNVDELLGIYRKGLYEEKAYDRIRAIDRSRVTLGMEARFAGIPQVKLAAIEQLDDQLELAKVVCQHPKEDHLQPGYRAAAMKRIHSTDALLYVALNADTMEAPECAKKLSELDSVALTPRLLMAKHPGVCRMALEVLTPRQRMEAVLKEGKCAHRELALGLIKDKSLLCELARNSDNEKLRNIAALRSGDWELTKAALAQRSILYALDHIEDPDILLRLAAQTRDMSDFEDIVRKLKKNSEALYAQALSTYIGHIEVNDKEWVESFTGWLSINGHPESILFEFMTPAAVSVLEEWLTDGSTAAGAVLMKLYRYQKLSSALSSYAKAQAPRIRTQHTDLTRESSVCGETTTHDDFITDVSIMPL